jgi:hypothetical protein
MAAWSRIAWVAALCTIGLATGCERLLSIRDPVAGDGAPGDDGPLDGGLSRSSPILLSEVAVSPNNGEMIEIVNTSSEEVDLATYYLSDSASYFRLPVAASVDQTDFIVRFPDGTRLKGHGVMTIAIDMPAAFATVYGISPDFSVADQSMDRIAVNGTPRLTDTGEPIILFQWDRHSDLVRDVDIMVVGTPMPANVLVSKSGVSQDGPDLDKQSTAYAVESNLLQMASQQQAAAPGTGLSTKRLALEEGHEDHGSTGNGQSGDDETSEKILETWDTGSFTSPTPGDVPAALLR